MVFWMWLWQFRNSKILLEMWQVFKGLNNMNYGWVVALVILMATIIDGLWLWHKTGLTKKGMASTSYLGCLWLAILLAIAGICLDFTTTYVGITFFGFIEKTWTVAQWISWGWWVPVAVDITLFSWLIILALLARKFWNFHPDFKDWVFMPVIFLSWMKLSVGGANLLLIIGIL